MRKMISVSEKTWRALAAKGTLTDSFDSVIKKLLSDKEGEQGNE